MNTILKPFASLIANAAGNTSNADTNSTPIVGIITEIAIPVKILNDIDNRFVFTPLAVAVS